MKTIFAYAVAALISGVTFVAVANCKVNTQRNVASIYMSIHSNGGLN